MKESPHEFSDQYIYLSGALMKRAGLQLIRCGKNEAKQNYSIGPKFIHYYGLHFVLDGSVEYIDQENHVMLNKGDLFCLYPNKKYTYRILPDTDNDPPLRMYWLTMYGDLAPLLLTRIGLSRNRPTLSQRFDETIVQSLDQILDTCRADEHNHTCELFLLHTMISLFEVLSKRNDPETDEREQESWLQKGLQYIHLHFRDDIRVSEVAQYVGIDRTHFSRTFQTVIKQSPNAYIQHLRLKEANSLLQTGSFTIAQIADSLGYSDANTFTRAYKRVFGSPPSQRKPPLS